MQVPSTCNLKPITGIVNYFVHFFTFKMNGLERNLKQKSKMDAGELHVQVSSDEGSSNAIYNQGNVLHGKQNEIFDQKSTGNKSIIGKLETAIQNMASKLNRQ